MSAPLTPRFGLRGLATMIIVGVTVLSLVVTTGVSVLETNRSIRHQHQMSVDDAAYSLAAGCERALAEGDTQELTRLAHRFVQRENGAFVAIQDDAGRVVSYTQARPGEWERFRQNPNNTRDFAVAEHAVTAFNGHGGSPADPNAQPRPAPAQPRVLGKVLIGDSTDGLRSAQRRQTLRACLVALLMAGVAVPLALFLFQFWVRRLNRLLVASDRVASGDLDTPVTDGHRDEIGRLAKGLDQLRRAVKKQHQKLQAFNGTLQTQVEERTRALNHTLALTKGILASAADGVITIDPEGKIGAFNPAAARIFGIKPAAAEGLDFNSLLANDVRVDPSGVIHRQTGDAVQVLGTSAEIEAINGEAEHVPIQISLAALKINGRKHLTAVMRDISERKQADAEREEMVAQLLDASRHAGMAEVATSVLHNVGNVLNSINVSVQFVQTHAQSKAAAQLGQAADVIEAHKRDFAGFVASDPRGKHLPEFVTHVSRVIGQEREAMLQELKSLADHVEHVKRIIKTQQSYAKTVGVDELTNLKEMIQDALRINAEGLRSYRVQVYEQLADLPDVPIDKHACLQILVNLIRNARNAMETQPSAKTLTVRLIRHPKSPERFQIHVQDSGYGIKPENLTRIFNHGFTTRKEGNGYGLHSAAVAAQKMGGSLTATSEGEGQGACFILDLPTQPPKLSEQDPSEDTPLDLGQGAPARAA